MKYCPLCRAELELGEVDNEVDSVQRLHCPAPHCEFIHWDNPIPVLAVIVEYDGKVLLAHNVAWPGKIYSVITGFLEKGESPEEGVMRELKEELNLTAESANFIGLYPFHEMNQLIIAYHLEAHGDIQLNHELDDYKLLDKADVKHWPFGTGLAVKDWLLSQGIGVD